MIAFVLTLGETEEKDKINSKKLEQVAMNHLVNHEDEWANQFQGSAMCTQKR